MHVQESMQGAAAEHVLVGGEVLRDFEEKLRRQQLGERDVVGLSAGGVIVVVDIIIM